MRSMIRLVSGAAATVLCLTGATAPANAAVPGHPGAQQWTLDADHFGADRIWPLSTGRGVTVAVVDSGVDAHHPDLAGRVRPGVDLVGDAADGRVDLSANGHGTSVGGIIAGNGAGPGSIAGLAPDAMILPVRIADGLASDPAVLAQGIDYATTHGAGVINVSTCTPILNPQVRTAVAAAIQHDVIVVAAAGNDGLSGNLPQYPAALPGVLAVAASDVHGSLWPSSESGPYLGLTAPGVAVYTTGSQGSRGPATGTSFAAPQVAAAAALLRSRFPHESATQIISRLTSTAQGHDDGRSARRGFGIVDPYRALLAQPPSPTVDDPLRQAVTGDREPAEAGDSRPTALIVAGVAALVVAAVAGMAILRRRRRRYSRR